MRWSRTKKHCIQCSLCLSFTPYASCHKNEHCLYVQKVRIQGALCSSALLEAQDSHQGLKCTWAVWVEDSCRMYTALSSMKKLFFVYFIFHFIIICTYKRKIPSCVTNFYAHVHSMADTILFLLLSTLPALSSPTSPISCPISDKYVFDFCDLSHDE